MRLRKVSQFDTVLAGVLRSGINNVMGVEFHTIQEQTGGGWWGWSPTANSFANMMTQNISQAGPSGDASEGHLSVGQISVTATVNVTFALE